MSVTPYQEGVVAAKVGAQDNENPYEAQTDAHSQWLLGYKAVIDYLSSLEDNELKSPMPTGPKE